MKCKGERIITLWGESGWKENYIRIRKADSKENRWAPMSYISQYSCPCVVPSPRIWEGPVTNWTWCPLTGFQVKALRRPGSFCFYTLEKPDCHVRGLNLTPSCCGGNPRYPHGNVTGRQRERDVRPVPGWSRHLSWGTKHEYRNHFGLSCPRICHLDHWGALFYPNCRLVSE